MEENKILELIDFVVGYASAAVQFNEYIPNSEILLQKFLESQK